MKNIYQLIPNPQSTESRLVLATVVATSGSTPQKPGISALFGTKGLLYGTVGGGVVEHKLHQIVQETLMSGVSGLYHFDLDFDIGQTDEAICGGQISILVDATPGDHSVVFDQINSSIARGKRGVLVTMVNLITDNRIHIIRLWMSRGLHSVQVPDIILPLGSQIDDMLTGKDPATFKEVSLPIENQTVRFFLELIRPLPRLVIAGAGHIGKALAHLGSLLAFEVTVIDDRPEFANRENLPDADEILVDDIGHALNNLAKTTDTYIVIVTRGHKDDAAALAACIGSPAAYVGMIGSSRKTALMRQQFLDEKLCTHGQWESIHTPIGLEIGSKTVQEIAVSIAAQLIQQRNKLKLK